MAEYVKAAGDPEGRRRETSSGRAHGAAPVRMYSEDGSRSWPVLRASLSGMPEEDPAFRERFESVYRRSGTENFDDYASGYRFGHEYGSGPTYTEMAWSQAVADIRHDWEAQGRGPWEIFNDAVRYGWERSRLRS